MKNLLSFAAIIAVAVAVPAHRSLVEPGPAGPAPVPEPIAIGPAIIDSFEPVAIGPALVESPEPVAIEPAWIESPEPIAVGPAIIESPKPLPDGGAVSAPSGSRLVQIILNINQAAPEPVAIGPAYLVPEPIHEEIIPEPVQIVETAPEPVEIVEVAPEPVQVVEALPTPEEAVVVETPVIPNPVNPPIIDLN